MVGLAHRTRTDHLESELQKVRYSNVSGIQMVSIHITNVCHGKVPKLVKGDVRLSGGFEI